MNYPDLSNYYLLRNIRPAPGALKYIFVIHGTRETITYLTTAIDARNLDIYQIYILQIPTFSANWYNIRIVLRAIPRRNSKIDAYDRRIRERTARGRLAFRYGRMPLRFDNESL